MRTARAIAAALWWLLAAPTAAASPTLSSLGAATLVRASQTLGRRAFVTGSPRCPAAARRCIGIALHVVEAPTPDAESDAASDADGEEGDGEPAVKELAPVVTPAWFAGQVETANRLFAEVDVGFFVESVAAAPAEHADMQTRSQRDRLGRADHSKGPIHVYVVRRLADVDVAGAEIRGVHWRDRSNTQRRWVILSSIASHLVLAHELGHFFSLPHSSYRISIMNKKPAPGRPPWPDRVFHPEELTQMRQARDEMVEDGTVRDHGAAAR